MKIREDRVSAARHVSKLSFAEIEADPAFPSLLDLLTKLGLLAGKWTAEDVLTALDRLQTRVEVIATTAPAESYEELCYQRALRRDVHEQTPEIRAYQRMYKQELRADEAFREAERAQERVRKQKKRKLERQQFLETERANRKTALKARLNHPIASESRAA